MRNSMLCLTLVAIAALTGCAHPMVIRPDIGALSSVSVPEGSRIQKTVGLYIPAADKEKLVTSKAGGGDKVQYKPYADLETGIYKVLSDVFQRVTLIKAPGDAAAQSQLAYVVQPEITTTSDSSGVITWMVTDFTVTVNCKISDPAGAAVTNVSATGTGQAVFKEVSSNFSVAGERASLDALGKLRTALLESAALKK